MDAFCRIRLLVTGVLLFRFLSLSLVPSRTPFLRLFRKVAGKQEGIDVNYDNVRSPGLQ